MKVNFIFPLERGFTGGIKTSFQRITKALAEQGTEVVHNEYSLDCDVIHVWYPLVFVLPLVKLAKAKDIPVVFHVHSTYEDTVDSFVGNKFFASYVRFSGKQFSGMADRLITPSEYTKKIIVADGWAEPEDISVVSNGIDTSEFSHRPPRKLNSRAVVGSLSTVMPRKGVELFLETAELLPKHPFVWYGKIFPTHAYPKGGELSQKMAEKSENVFFHGFAKDLKKAYDFMDIFTSFSKVENEGIPAMEAASQGIPLVLRDIPPYKEKFEGSALFFDTAEGASEAIEKLVSDPQLRRSLRKKARKSVEKYTLPNVVDKLVRIYEDLQ